MLCKDAQEIPQTGIEWHVSEVVNRGLPVREDKLNQFENGNGPRSEIKALEPSLAYVNGYHEPLSLEASIQRPERMSSTSPYLDHPLLPRVKSNRYKQTY